MPVPGPHEVVVEVRSVGICGSDVHYYEHGRIGDFVVNAPMVLGHESSGVVVDAGTSSLRVGQRVTMEPGVPCGHCEQCRRGTYNLCPNVVFFATPPVRRLAGPVRRGARGVRLPGARLDERRRRRPDRAAVGGPVGEPEGRHRHRLAGAGHRRRADRRAVRAHRQGGRRRLGRPGRHPPGPAQGRVGLRHRRGDRRPRRRRLRRFPAGRAAGVHRRAAGGDRRHQGPAAAGHAPCWSGWARPPSRPCRSRPSRTAS